MMLVIYLIITLALCRCRHAAVMSFSAMAAAFAAVTHVIRRFRLLLRRCRLRHDAILPAICRHADIFFA